MLFTSLTLALIFHPFSGSLIYGPTNRVWLMAPTSLVIEMLYIWIRLLEHLSGAYDLWWPYDRITGTSHDSTFHNVAYALVAARTLNSPRGEARAEIAKAGSTSEIVGIAEAAVKRINEGLISRIGIAFPILAQFVKILSC